MIRITTNLDVELTKPNIFQAIVAKQYDMNTRFLNVTLKDNGTRVDIPNIETAKVIINAERKDGQSKGFEGEINDDGTVTVPLHSWMLELDGTVVCDISVIDTAADDNKKLTTTSFTLLVEKAAFGGTDITNDPQFDVLVKLIEAAETADEALEKSKEALKLVEDCEEATEEAKTIKAEIEAGGYIESLKETNNGSKFSTWVGTEAEYKGLSEKELNCLYITTDDDQTDYIVATGTVTQGNCKWVYEKLKSGIIKLYGFENRTVSVTPNGTTILLYSGVIRSANIAFALPTNLGISAIHTFIPQANGGTDVGAWGGQGYWASDLSFVSTDVFCFEEEVEHKGKTNIGVNFNLMVVGTWEEEEN